MSKQKVYGQQTEIFIDDGSGLKRLGEITSFNYKFTDIVKKHSSLGESGVGTIDVLDDGGTLSFEADKSDSRLSTFFSLAHTHLRGGSKGKAGRRGKAPYFRIEARFTYTDESDERIIFEGVALHDNEGSVSGRTEVFSEKFQGTFKTSYVSNNGGEASVSGAEGQTILSTALLQLANLSANVTTEFPETVNVKDYSKA